MDRAPETPSATSADRLFDGGGECGALMRAIDWTQTPLGPVETWPQSLKTIVRIMFTSRQPIWIGWGPDLIKMYNDPYKAIVGGKHPEAMGRPASVVWREIWDVLGPRLETVMQTNAGTYDESLLLIMERNGYPEETYYTFSYSPVPGDEGGVGGIICANTDDTQRIIGERQLKLLRTLAAATSDAHTIEEACRLSAAGLAQNPHDLPFAMLYLLDAQQQMVCVGTAGISKGHPAVPETAPLDADGLWLFQDVIRSGKAAIIADLDQRFGHLPTGAWKRPPHQAVVLPIAPSGHTGKAGVLIVGLNPFRLFDEGYQGFLQLAVGQLAATLASAHAYEAESQRAEALAEIDRAKTAFFSNVSHEFRTPLTLMLAPLEDLLAGDSMTPATHNQITVIQRNSLRLLKLVNTLLDFSRIEAGRAQAIYVPTDLDALTADLASVFRSLIEKAGMRLIVDCSELSEPAYVDRDMWEKIVLNLLSNAFKFTLEGEIAVSLRQIEHQAQLVVRDTGVGIPPDEVAHLFERFHRVQGTRARTYEGSGIGLALVQELVHLHHGTIAVESQVDMGTTFTITLPLGKAHLPADRIQASRTRGSTALGAAPFVEEARRWLPESTQVGASYQDWLAQESPTDPPFLLKLPQERSARILLADDNADLRDYLTRLLRQRYEVEAVSNGAAALRAAQGRPPDLVLSDVMMPELDGFGLLRELRADPRTRTIPVILLSARAGEEATIEGLTAGADDYLVKPFSARELLARVEGRLEMARLRKEAEAHAAELEAFFESMTDGIDIVNAEGQIRQMNRAGYQHLGLGSQEQAQTYFSSSPETRSRLLSMRDDQGQALPPERAPAARIVRGESLAGQSGMDVQVRTFDGRERAWNFSGAPIRNEQGNIIGGVVAFRDVTARRSLERALAEQAALLDTAFEAITESLIIHNRSGQIVRMNAAASRLLGFETSSEYSTRPNDQLSASWDVLDLAGRPVPREQLPIRRVLAGETIPAEQAIELQFRASDGRMIIANYSGSPLRDQAGAITGAISVSRDVTERYWLERRTAESLSALLAMAQALVQGMSADNQATGADAGVLLSIARLVQRVMDGQFTAAALVTPETGAIQPLMVLGISPELEARWWSALNAGKLTDFVPPAMAEQLYAGEVLTLNLTDQSPISGQYYFELQQLLAVAVWVNPRQVCLIAVEMRNRTTFTQAEQDLVKAAAQLCALVLQRDRLARERAEAQAHALALEETNRRMDEFLSIASHELRTPVTSIKSNLQLLLRRATQAINGSIDDQATRLREQAPVLRRTERQINRLTRLLEDLIDLSRIRAGKLEMRLEPTDLGNVVRETVEGESLAHPDRRINLDLQANGPIPVVADVDRIGQVLTNYLSNALKYSYPDRPVLVRAQIEGAQARVSVQDQGPGIPPDEQPHVWELFHRVPSIQVLSGSGVGLGLGLHISKTIIDRHQGQVGLESIPSAGATFWFTLPLVPPEQVRKTDH